MFKRTEKMQLSIIKQIEIESSKYINAISLAQGIPDLDTPQYIKGKVAKALARGIVSKYSLSPGLPELRELIAESLATENMFYDWEKEILITAGSIEGITATILTITNPGDEVIIPEPTYTSYREVIYLAGCQPVFVPLDESRGWAFNIQKYEEAITDKTKAIFYCNPNNPTGTIYNKEQLLELATLADRYNLFLISDEVYKDFIYDKIGFFSLAEIPSLRKKLIRIFSFSKAYAMTGWRVAYLHSDVSITQEILKVHDSLVTCAPVISQYGAIGALELDKQKIKEFRDDYRHKRDLICRRISKLKNVFSFVKPDSAYYVFPKINPVAVQGLSYNSKPLLLDNGLVDSFNFAFWLLAKIQLAVVPGVAFGPNGEGHIRISFGRSVSDINEAFDRLEKIFKI